jgi:hypothetical protein
MGSTTVDLFARPPVFYTLGHSTPRKTETAIHSTIVRILAMHLLRVGAHNALKATAIQQIQQGKTELPQWRLGRL